MHIYNYAHLTSPLIDSGWNNLRTIYVLEYILSSWSRIQHKRLKMYFIIRFLDKHTPEYVPFKTLKRSHLNMITQLIFAEHHKYANLCKDRQLPFCLDISCIWFEGQPKCYFQNSTEKTRWTYIHIHSNKKNWQDSIEQFIFTIK